MSQCKLVGVKDAFYSLTPFIYPLLLKLRFHVHSTYSIRGERKDVGDLKYWRTTSLALEWEKTNFQVQHAIITSRSAKITNTTYFSIDLYTFSLIAIDASGRLQFPRNRRSTKSLQLEGFLTTDAIWI